MSSEIIFDIQGFKESGNEFVVKELAAITIQNNSENLEDLICVHFKSPCKWTELSNKYKYMNSWLIDNYHGIPWEAGTIPYNNLRNVLNTISRDRDIIYVKGTEKKRVVESVIDYKKKVVDLEYLECPKLTELEVSQYQQCPYYKYHKFVSHDYHCAAENVQKLKWWFMQHCVINPSLERSLKLYCQFETVQNMEAEDLNYLPKSFLLRFASYEIEDVWDKLSEELQQDNDIAACRRCYEHYPMSFSGGAGEGGDVLDGLPPLIKNCYECKKNISYL